MLVSGAPPQSNPMGIEATVNMDPVLAIATAIVSIYQKERAASKSAQPIKNYFIVVGHSQGNFFVEGVGYRLMRYAGGAGISSKIGWASCRWHRRPNMTRCRPNSSNASSSITPALTTR